MSAVLSPDRIYRYRLDRAFVVGEGRVLFVMLNPSKADEVRNDSTISKCLGFARRWGYAEVSVVNLYALRSTNPGELLRHERPVGERDQTGGVNDRMIGLAAAGSDRIVVAWGDHRARLLPNPAPRAGPSREQRVYDILRAASGRPVYCLGRCASGAPRHPVRLSYSAPLEPWSP